MIGKPEERKMEKKAYEKPELKRYGKLTDVMAELVTLKPK